MVTSQFLRGATPFRQVIGFSVAQWRRFPATVAAVTLCVSLWTLCEVLMPVLAGRLVDAVSGARSDAARDAALSALGGMLGLGTLVVLARHLGFLAITRLTLACMANVARSGFARVQRLSTEWQANNFAGSTVRKISRGMWALDTLDDCVMLALLPSLLVLLLTTLMLGARWPVMGLVIATGALCYIALALACSLGYVAPAARLSNQWDTRVGGALADAVSCNAVVKSFGAETREDLRFDRTLTKWARRTRRVWVRGTNSGTAQATLLLILQTSVVGTSLWLWWNDRASPGDITWVLTAYFVVHGYLREVGQHIAVLQRSVNDMHELVALHAERPSVQDRSAAPPIDIRHGGIVFDRVAFHHSAAATPLFDNLSVTIAPGEHVGLVGRSGSGKTTFVKLIQRLYDVTGGRILVDGHDIADVAQDSLRAQIAIVQQDPVLFHRSLAENIAYGRPGATQDAIEHAARLANAHDFIARLPRGHATLVGERGVKLSGGERQRVALARAFIADAPILILDEATSSLDSESEHLIQEAMLRLLEGRTAIVIAHRLSTVMALDRILVFDRGRIVDQGTHADLVAHDGVYRRLFTTQVAGMTELI